MEPVDIVIPWVDSNDPDWQKEYYKNKPACNDTHSATSRFRDWDLMRYWFRGIEENMPWVRTIYFITCGHIPEWLNIKNKKLKVVNHSDYIPSEYLPLFSSHVIEIFLHKIEGLSERFIYFNDDVFTLKNIPESYFFKKTIPCDTFAFNALDCGNISHIIMNDIKEINESFNKKEVVKKNISGVFSYKYPEKSLRSLLLMPWPRITGFFDHHLPQPYLKSTFDDVWLEKKDILVKTAKQKFRTNDDVNQYLFRYWQLCTGNYKPFNLYKYAKYYSVTDGNIDEITSVIENKKSNILVINDDDIKNFVVAKNKIHVAFASIYPNKSSYELD
ncbi:Stealth CR1 domain-containing protein [Klebsiella sp. WP7-S18-ESBL-04]|uniref:Stealth CR1 domain-containing protein n=1 Tax=Klebsiella sp. WP7-S18-ESBL-04 TaxID=2675718 RepID=UPI0015DD096B|nr:Stealth CR1 domain-containing protein [Klebsiella sp. WP7-S18-ESBL-04]BBT02378.1 glycosyl transferase [Klebsiella sp. WP7-S18-ESBL-04]